MAINRIAPEGLDDSVDICALITLARDGSAPALGQLLEGCRRYLLFVANDALDSGLRPKGGALDLVQETFVEAQRDIVRFRGTTERELLAWLKEILANRVANQARRYAAQKRAVNREIPLEPNFTFGQPDVNREQDEPVDATIERDEQERLVSALARLPQHLREVIEMRTWQGQSFPEIAARLNTTSEAARKKWSRAVRRLHRELRQNL